MRKSLTLTAKLVATGVAFLGLALSLAQAVLSGVARWRRSLVLAGAGEGAAMAAFVESVGSDPRRAHVAFIDVVGVSPRVEKHRVDQRSVWATFFESIIKGIVGEDYEPPGGYRWASTAFIGALTALVHQWSTAEPRPPVSVLVDLMTVLLNALIDDAPLHTDE